MRRLKMKSRRIVAHAAGPAALAALLAACTPPDTAPQLSQRAPADLGLTGASMPAIDPDWWTAFGDPQLDRIVADASAGNPDLAAALARVRQAQAVLARRDAETGPDITGDANAQVARLSGRYTIPPPYGGSVRFLGTAQANLSWNLDLFGRQRAAIEGARASLTAARFDVDAARLMLAGSIVATYAEVARAERIAAIARQTIAARERAVRLTNTRVQNQLASKLDVQAAVTLLAQARVALTRAEAARVIAVDALAALAGRGSDYAAGIGPTRLSDPVTLALPATIPADLLARRADIAAAAARVDAAAAGRQVARRAFYPDVNLVALAGLQAVGIGNLFNADAGTAGAGAALHLPIFDSGRLEADLAGATAQVDLAIADYNRTVVGAVREAADALAQIRANTAEARAQAEVVRGFAETNRLNAVRINAGLESRLTGIDTDIRLLDAQLASATLSVDALAARARLAQALGGGFDPSRNPAS
ncbi:efflux transporter, outer membrane factor (OMF) lipoprotein, NodT family [Sphingomonas sp. OV641]|uniref:efflux transporter outer membrane subunit n=1 Tax=Sphingomonas sp. OV641 TaxID=1881068 RepID=UPI0008C175F1|nr:efflux transporter outer membrane subunit [Sphingomonas sp. OV641]SEJ60491.1 efflux transporter, outer membrane factor (OMF) lipoprotein, NodT family [Sphingomonas sp. OV641]